ncbi:hypothetical protein [Rudaea sp.]|uniref:hypothetical protein n=1 Tax=Rudaea sp. TaxID=2136325 RepID=UPI00322080D8
MVTPDESELLALWECGLDLPAPQRALLLLAATCPQASVDELKALRLGRSNELLVRLRVRLFGTRMNLIAACPQCSAQLEAGLDANDLLAASARAGEDHAVVHGSLTFRPLALGDLIGLPGDPGQAQRLLLARCRDSAPDGGADADVAALAASEMETVARALAAADPQADPSIELKCSGCAHAWNAAFDIGAFLWRELDAWARRILREVHALARAYAWSERDALAVGPTRRQIYLQLSGI